MKIQKKILSVALCTLLSVGCNQANLLRANAQEITKSNTSSKDNVQWEEGLRLRLTDKYNPSPYPWAKDWCEIKLVCKNGNIQLEGNPNIPDRLTFDDTITIGCSDHMTCGPTKTIFKVESNMGLASKQLQQAIGIFNEHAPKMYDDIYVHGMKSDETFLLHDYSHILTNLPICDYTRKYNSIWDRGYKLRPYGLVEEIFRHTPTGVQLANRYYEDYEYDYSY